MGHNIGFSYKLQNKSPPQHSLNKFHHCNWLYLLYGRLILNTSNNYYCSSTNWCTAITQNSFSAMMCNTCSSLYTHSLSHCLACVHQEAAAGPCIGTLRVQWSSWNSESAMPTHTNYIQANTMQDMYVTHSVLLSIPFQSLVQCQKVLRHHRFHYTPPNSQNQLCGDYCALSCFS